MAKRGRKLHLKRLAAHDKLVLHNKKEYKFLLNTSPGPHKKGFSVPLALILRDYLKIANNLKEAIKIINEGKIKIDGRVVKDKRFPVGFMDIIEIGNNRYRMLINNSGKLVVEEDNQGYVKPLKIKNKVTVKGGIFQLTFHDGRTFLTKDNNYKVNDVVLFDLNKKEIIDLINYKPGVNCIVIDGRHAGRKGVIEDIIDRNGKKEVVVSTNDKKIITRFDYIFPLFEGW